MILNEINRDFFILFPQRVRLGCEGLSVFIVGSRSHGGAYAGDAFGDRGGQTVILRHIVLCRGTTEHRVRKIIGFKTCHCHLGRLEIGVCLGLVVPVGHTEIHHTSYWAVDCARESEGAVGYDCAVGHGRVSGIVSQIDGASVGSLDVAFEVKLVGRMRSACS